MQVRRACLPIYTIHTFIYSLLIPPHFHSSIPFINQHIGTTDTSNTTHPPISQYRWPHRNPNKIEQTARIRRNGRSGITFPIVDAITFQHWTDVPLCHQFTSGCRYFSEKKYDFSLLSPFHVHIPCPFRENHVVIFHSKYVFYSSVSTM